MRFRAESGVVLVVTLIMLAVVTLIGTVSANVVMGNLRVVENIEARAVAKSSALSAMQEAIMTSGFLQGEKAFVVSCKGDSYARCFDMTGDQIADEMRVTLSKPKCISAIPVRNASLKVWQNPDDASCYQPGVYSLCADALWEVTMRAEDPITGAKVVFRQGLSTRTSVNLIAAACS